jgi:uracil-DNA glycosylase family 4
MVDSPPISRTEPTPTSAQQRCTATVKALAVRCVPPQNKPTPAEITNCRSFLTTTIEAMPNLRAIVALGRIAHESLLRALETKLSAAPFAHGAVHDIAGYRIYDSYHCSRYNTNTGVLTTDMFEAVFARVRDFLDR